MTDFRLAADAYLDECFGRQSPPHVNELAQRFGLTRAQLRRAFVAQNSIQLASYLKSARVARAQKLLITTSLSLDDVARKAAFGTRTTFFRAFRQATGMSPRAWRVQNATGAG